MPITTDAKLFDSIPIKACSCAETIDGIMLAFKEQKDTTLYLRNVSGLLQTKWMQMVKQREDLNEHVDNMIADFSHAIDKFDEDGKKRHEELHNEVRRRKGWDGPFRVADDGTARTARVSFSPVCEIV